MHISSVFDSGNIEVVSGTDLNIRLDAGGEHMQWFHFRVSGAEGDVRLRILNAKSASYPVAWVGYRACVSTDRQNWRRVDTTFDDGVLEIAFEATSDVVWVAYFAPYSWERHMELVGWAQNSPLARVDQIGTTLDGRELDRVTVGTGPKQVWIIARQHPGESMAEWWVEGFLERLMDPDDALARKLRALLTFHVVPNMNPDGSVRGHLRCNATGANLNREWHGPTAERSPEVLNVLREMDSSGVDFFMDVHGDEELPYVFISGCEGTPGWDEERAAKDKVFRDAYERVCPDFQQVHGYGIDKPGEANMTMAGNQVAERFSCLGLTLEMPFKDNKNAPDEEFGWSPERSKLLGAAVLEPLAVLFS
ncbi:MAG: carboxypeptidase family protein [Proteobacteria bacterium]|nr:carboxypeptidase family protein [Pseudomonadota bacterium]MCP4917848.1 carboxypeptidase family protein [Pseudomonadota bacterium]